MRIGESHVTHHQTGSSVSAETAPVEMSVRRRDGFDTMSLSVVDVDVADDVVVDPFANAGERGRSVTRRRS